jgi:hypothetical protein
MWTFLVELAEIADPIESTSYPNLMYSHGELPDSPPEKVFEAESDNQNTHPDFDEYDDFQDNSYDNYDDLWN